MIPIGKSFGTTTADRMAVGDVVSLLGELIPIAHRHGQDHYVEALSEAIDAIAWRHLAEAPRDGTYLLLAVAPLPAFNSPGYVTIGRWFVPDDRTAMGKPRRVLFERYGGWWSSGRNGKPYQRAVLGWRPIPAFDFNSSVDRDPDAATGCADDQAFAICGKGALL